MLRVKCAKSGNTLLRLGKKESTNREYKGNLIHKIVRPIPADIVMTAPSMSKNSLRLMSYGIEAVSSKSSGLSLLEGSANRSLVVIVVNGSILRPHSQLIILR